MTERPTTISRHTDSDVLLGKYWAVPGSPRKGLPLSSKRTRDWFWDRLRCPASTEGIALLLGNKDKESSSTWRAPQHELYRKSGLFILSNDDISGSQALKSWTLKKKYPFLEVSFSILNFFSNIPWTFHVYIPYCSALFLVFGCQK